MTAAAIALFAAWEVCLFAASLALAWRFGWGNDVSEERWLAVLAIEVTLESSIAAIFSFTRINSPAAYWAVAAACAAFAGLAGRPAFAFHAKPPESVARWHFAALAALALPLVCLSFHPVEEIDSINYLHYLIDWMGNRATPYTFATSYVAFWELSFLPTWMVTGMDAFFPLLALKSVVLLALAAWLVGRELGLRGPLLLWTVAAFLALRHLWFESSGVGTLKNDALHGAGFLLLMLALLRGGRSLGLLAFGAAFAAVKYTGIFLAGMAFAVVAVNGTRRKEPESRRKTGTVLLVASMLFLATSGHYYLRTLIQHGSPFYPFQINLGPLHLPGTADLSATSILYSLRDPRLWRVLFWPAGGLSPAGLLFPLVLAAILPLAAWRCVAAAWRWMRLRTAPAPMDWAAAWILCGWLLYFRSVFSASAQIGGGDLSFLLYGLNSIRYVDGVLAGSELWLVALAGRTLAWPLVAIQLASRLYILYPKIPAALFPPLAIAAAALLAAVGVMWLGRRAVSLAAAALLAAGPLVVERNRVLWTVYWNGLKPALATARPQGLAVLAMPDGGYFAAHVVAAGNPVDPAVAALEPEVLDAMAPNARPRYLALLAAPGTPASTQWRELYGGRLAAWGYRPEAEIPSGALFRR